MRRTKAEAAVTKETLFKAGLSVFSRKGYTATTLEDIAREAGVTRGAIYWHFGSKAELYNALLNEYASRSGPLVQAAIAEGGSLVDVLRRVYTRLLVAVATDDALRAAIEISLFKAERSPELQPNQAIGRALLGSLGAAMRQGIASGELRGDLDPDEMARAFLASNNGAISLWLTTPAAFSLEASAPALAEIFISGIRAQRG